MRYWIQERLETRSVAQLCRLHKRAAQHRLQPSRVYGPALREFAAYVAERVNATHVPEVER